MARLGRPHGLDGFLGLYVDPSDVTHFEVGSPVMIQDQEYLVRELRKSDRGYQVAFAGVVDRPGAELIRNQDVFVSQRRELGDGEFWPTDLIGLEVRTGGKVIGVEHGPAQDRLVIERGEVVFEIPFVEDLVPVVDIKAGFVEIVEIEGLSEPS